MKPNVISFSRSNKRNESRTSVYFAEEAVGFVADGARELVHVVLEDAPACAVGRLAVITVLAAGLGDAQPQFQKLLMLLLGKKLKTKRSQAIMWDSNVCNGYNGNRLLRFSDEVQFQSYRFDFSVLKFAVTRVLLVYEGTRDFGVRAVQYCSF